MTVIRETKWLSLSGRKTNTNSSGDKVESIGNGDNYLSVPIPSQLA